MNANLKLLTPFMVAFLLIFTGCKRSDDCDSADLPDTSFYLGIVDSKGNLLLGEDNIYDPAEISLSRDGQQIELLVEGTAELGFFFYVNYINIVSGEDYFLRLNESETDILNITTKLVKGECFDFLKLESLRVNGMEIIEDGGVYRIVK